MASNETSQVRLYEIIGDPTGWAIYNDRFRFEVPLGTHAALIQELANGSDHAELLGPSLGRGATTSLDIVEDQTGGVCVYAFKLNALVDDRHRLRFVDSEQGKPFVQLPSNSSSNENFWLENRVYDEVDGRWASFAIDIGAARDSPLARRIQYDAEQDPPLLHSHQLTIPFSFNVVDPLLEAAPWMAHPEVDAADILNPWIHGGVHPRPVAFVRIPL